MLNWKLEGKQLERLGTHPIFSETKTCSHYREDEIGKARLVFLSARNCSLHHFQRCPGSPLRGCPFRRFGLVWRYQKRRRGLWSVSRGFLTGLPPSDDSYPLLCPPAQRMLRPLAVNIGWTMRQLHYGCCAWTLPFRCSVGYPLNARLTERIL
jgi:hypothetical protein